MTYTPEKWKEKLEAEKRKIADSYTPHGEGSRCKKCGSTVMALVQSHRILVDFGYNSRTDSGLIIRHYPAFCPKCEKQPEPDNEPIVVWPETEVRFPE